MQGIKNFGVYILIPLAIVLGLSLVGQLAVGTPAPVAPIVNSGETWWNPVSWALDESAQHANQQANLAQTASISYTQLMFLLGAGISGIVGVLMIQGIQRGHIAQLATEPASGTPASGTPASGKSEDPPQRAPDAKEGTVIVEDGRDAVLAGQPQRKAGK